MKFSKYFMLAGAAAMLTACSTEEPLMQEPQGYPVPAEVAENDAYALFNISLPENAGTRAAAEPADAPLEDEYLVYNTYLMLFQKSTAEGATEGDATYVRRVRLTTSWQNEEDAADLNRTTYVVAAFEKGTFKEGESYMGLIVTNVDANAYPWPTSPVAASEGVEAKAGQTFSSWATSATSYTFTYSVGSSKYMTMISAPSYNTTTKQTATLVDINPAAIKSSAAELDPSTLGAIFFIHRVPAKISLSVDCNVTGEKNQYKITKEGLYKDATVYFNAWAADGVAKTSYPTQNVSGLNLSAAHMNSAANSDFTSFTRCNWTKGAYYDLAYDAANYDRTSASALTTFPSHVYIKENTTLAQNMSEQRTTRVVMKAQYVEKDHTPADQPDLVLLGNNARTFIDRSALVGEIQQKAYAVIGGDKVEDFTVTPKNPTASPAGKYSLTDYCTIKKGDTELTAAQMGAVAVSLGLTSATAKEIAVYTKGVCYYAVYVEHFGDDGASLGNKVINSLTDYVETSHLGRYGVVRNNWYDITVNSVSKIGEPTIPDPTTDPVDKPDTDEKEVIDFSIKMLNWAKRSQGVDL